MSLRVPTQQKVATNRIKIYTKLPMFEGAALYTGVIVYSCMKCICFCRGQTTNEGRGLLIQNDFVTQFRELTRSLICAPPTLPPPLQTSCPRVCRDVMPRPTNLPVFILQGNLLWSVQFDKTHEQYASRLV